MSQPSSNWRTATSLAERECETCAHALMVRIVAADHRFCGEPSVLQTMGRDRVAAGLARDEACGGRQWRPR